MTGTYYVSQTLNGCESMRTAVEVTINVTEAPVAMAQSFCDAATVADLMATGTDLMWYASMDSVVEILNSNPEVKLIINGHADPSGDVCKNLILSEKRAKSVEKYILSKGIPATRILIRGFGSAQPKTENNTQTGRAHNRRVSFEYKN
jgi:hypothetical protein